MAYVKGEYDGGGGGPCKKKMAYRKTGFQMKRGGLKTNWAFPFSVSISKEKRNSNLFLCLFKMADAANYKKNYVTHYDTISWTTGLIVDANLATTNGIWGAKLQLMEEFFFFP